MFVFTLQRNENVYMFGGVLNIKCCIGKHLLLVGHYVLPFTFRELVIVSL
jgi:hypothetical protein